MADPQLKEILNFTDNGINKTKVVFSEKEKETEIIFEGSGKIKVALEV